MANQISTASKYCYIQKPLSVVVEGNIASGKSRFLEYCDQFGYVEVMQEPFHMSKNVGGTNLLEKYYSNPNQWAMTFKSYITLNSVQNYLRVPIRPIRMTEQSLHSYRNCLVESMFENGLMEIGMVSVVDSWYDFLNCTFKLHPNVIVYIHSTPNIIHGRVTRRGRPEESNISLQYIQQMHRLYEERILREHERIINGASQTLILQINGDLPLIELTEKYSECLANIRLNAMSKTGGSK